MKALLNSVLKLVGLGVGWYLLFLPDEIDILFLSVYLLTSLGFLIYLYNSRKKAGVETNDLFSIGLLELFAIGVLSILLTGFAERIGSRFIATEDIGSTFESDSYEKEYLLEIKSSLKDASVFIYHAISADTEQSEDGSYHVYYLWDLSINNSGFRIQDDFVCHGLKKKKWIKCEAIENGNEPWAYVR